MFAIEKLAALHPGCKLTAITMDRQGKDSCPIISPCEMDCQELHTTIYRCARHTSQCPSYCRERSSVSVRVHTFETCNAWELISADGKFKARVHADARDTEFSPLTVGKPDADVAYSRVKQRAIKLPAEFDPLCIARLCALPGVDSGEAI